MPKNIEMSVLGSDGTYDVLYPKNISDIVLSSEYLKGVFNLSDNSDIDDAFNYINRKIILLQYDKAGINVTLKSAGGNPLEGIPINGITANYNGTGSCVTDSNGKCFGYCGAGSVTVSTNKYVDMTVNSQQLSVLASEMYNVELTASNFVNFKKWTSSANNIMFSNNVSRVDVTCVGGGGGGGGAYYEKLGATIIATGGGGGGGYCVVQENVSFNKEYLYNFVVGAGGSLGNPSNGGIGGTSSFLNISANGGNGGEGGHKNYNLGGIGNGNGGRGIYDSRLGQSGYSGSVGSVSGYSSFTETVIYGGGGGGGPINNMVGYLIGEGGGYGGDGSSETDNDRNGEFGYGGGGGGGGVKSGYAAPGGSGGSGCVAIRIHLKVTA